MKTFLATTAIVLVMGGAAYAAPAQFNSYQSQATDVKASTFIGQRIYASESDVTAERTTAAGPEKDWADIGEINDVILGRDGAVKAVVLGVGGFLGMGEKDVAVSMNDVKFVKNGDSANDFFLVVNTTKDALNNAPAYTAAEDMQTSANTPADATTAADDTAANTTAVPDTATDTNTAANTTATTDMAKPADTAADQASSTTTTNNNNTADTAANTDMAKPADTANDQASSATTTNNNNTADTAANTDAQTTASTTTDGAVQGTMDESRTRLARPEVTREGYETAQPTELTADKLTGARVYGAQDEDVGEINRLVMNDSGQVQMVVLDIGGFLGMGEREIAVTPDELNIVRNTKGDDFRVYIDANKDVLKAQPEYKGQ